MSSERKEPPTEPLKGAQVLIDYVNWKGERAWRRIIPSDVRWGVAEWHPGAQWLLEAYDCDKKAHRTFAMKDIKEWRFTNGGDDAKDQQPG